MDHFELFEDLAVVEQMELETVRISFASHRRWHGVQVEIGVGVEPGFCQAHGHDEDPRFLGAGHIAGDRLAPGDHFFQ